MISVVVPSYLGEYKGAASNRHIKIHRSIQSLLNQKSKVDFEIVVVADGCEETFAELQCYASDVRFNCYLIPKQPLWSGGVRNTGIYKAQFPIITYMDIDDFAQPEFINTIAENFKDNDWVWFNDHIHKKGQFIERKCNINRMYYCGTSNLAHKKNLNAWWVKGSYLHDWHFIAELKKVSAKFEKIIAPGYNVCHINNMFDV